MAPLETVDKPDVPAADSTKQLLMELDTDWFPDPWYWALSQKSDWTSRVLTFDVPFPGGRTRTVPVLGVRERLSFVASAASAVRSVQELFAPGVFGFQVDSQGFFRHYRDELRRRARFEDLATSSLPFVGCTDIRSFFRNITLEHIENALAANGQPHQAELFGVLTNFTERFGYPLPEGHGASRGLASIVLLPVDRTISLRFARWLDDYRVFAASRAQAEAGLRHLTVAIKSIGLEVAIEKTLVSDSRATVGRYAASLADHGADPSASLEEALQAVQTWDTVNDNEKLLRLALRMSAECPNAADLATVSKFASKIPAVAYPRLAWMLWQHRQHPEAWTLILELLQPTGELDDWKRLRILPLLWYLPRHVVRETEPLLEQALSRQGPLFLSALRVAARAHPDLAYAVFNSLPDREQALIGTELEAGAGRTSVNSAYLPHVLAGPPIHSFL